MLVRPVSQLELLVISVVIGLGFAAFVRTAWGDRERSWNFSSFFLGGRAIGPSLTEHTTWGLTFAWANGVWFFAVLAYQFGPRVILLQLPWCLSVCLVALFLRPIMRAAGIGTVHGFLGRVYGPKARVVACVATSIGYVFNCGFEMYWGARMFALSIGYEELVLPTAIVFAGVCGAYCMIGGYLANCRTDKVQTVMGMAALTGLVILAGTSVPNIDAHVAGIGLAIICIAYIVLALTTHRLRPNTRRRLLNVAALAGVPLAGVFVFLLERMDAASPSKAIFTSSMPPLSLMIGIIVFQLFFNMVDMSNWQTVAANGAVSTEQLKEVRWSIVRSSMYMLWFPAMGGILLGCIARVHAGLADNDLFPAIFGMVPPDGPGITRGAVFGLLLLGLIATSLSSADSYIMAAAQTLSWDLVLSRPYDEIASLTSDADRERREQAFVERVRRSVLPLSIGMVLVFAGCYALWPSNVFAFQFIMYGSALSLFAPVVYGLVAQERGLTPSGVVRRLATAAIALGVLAGLIPYLATMASSGRDISIFSPILSLTTSSAVFCIGLVVRHFTRKEDVVHVA